MTQAVFTERELDVMGILWDVGGDGATVAEVQRRLPDTLAYTTVLTILRILEQKGYAAHVEEGKAYRYRPLVSREVAGQSALSRLVRKIFRGSPELLLTQLISDRRLSRDELGRMRDLVEKRLRTARKEKP